MICFRKRDQGEWKADVTEIGTSSCLLMPQQSQHSTETALRPAGTSSTGRTAASACRDGQLRLGVRAFAACRHEQLLDLFYRWRLQGSQVRASRLAGSGGGSSREADNSLLEGGRGLLVCERVCRGLLVWERVPGPPCLRACVPCGRPLPSCVCARVCMRAWSKTMHAGIIE